MPPLGGPVDNIDPTGATTKTPLDNRPETRGFGDKILADLAERLKECQMDWMTEIEDSTLSPAHTRNKQDETSRREVEVGSGAQSKLSNNQFTAGRDIDMNSYHGMGKENDTKASETPRASYADDEECVSPDNPSQVSGQTQMNYSEVATGMLIPASPLCILERDTLHDQIIAKLLDNNNARVAVLGMGGIGKTTLACSVANDSQIKGAYPRRLFLSFEGCSTSDLAYTNLASAFQIPADRRSSHRQILSQVLNYLKRGKTLFIIDNFETFWEVSSNRRAAEELLAQLAALPKLAMIVTLRGIQRPGNIPWVKIDPLQTLSQHGSMELLSIITDEEYIDSEYVQKLLDAVAGIPLAITLIGSLLRDESETPQSLWAQWTRESARAIRVANDVDSESDDRLYKLDISLRLSIFGPRMNENAKAALAAISILPIGMNMDESWLDRFQVLLPDTIHVRDSIRILRNVALAALDSSTTPPRLRLLPPVRDFCLKNLSLDGDLSRRLIDIYNTDMCSRWEIGSTENYFWVTMELSNINATINNAIILHYVTSQLGLATYHYTEWRRVLCIPDVDTIDRAINSLSELPQVKARCLQGFATTLLESNREQEAISKLELALSIHKEIGPEFAIGWDLYILGTAHRRLDNLADAERYLIKARDLFADIGKDRRKGSVLRALSHIYILQKKLPQAQEAAKEALELARASGSRRGEANALGMLGEVYRHQELYDLAPEMLTAATSASKAIYDIHGEACGNESLGLLYREIHKPHQAAHHFRLATSLYKKAQDSRAADRTQDFLTEFEAISTISEPGTG